MNVLVIDMGATRIKVVLVTEKGKIIDLKVKK